MRNAEFAGDRAGDEAVGRGDDGAQVAAVQMAPHQLAGWVADQRADVVVHVFAVPGIEFGARMVGQRCELEGQKLVDVERARLVVIVELDVLCLLHLAVDDTLADQELRPLEIGVTGEQGVVKIEEGEIHCPRSSGSVSLSSSRSNGSVTARLCSSV